MDLSPEELLEKLLGSIRQSLSQIDREKIDRFVDHIVSSERIFVVGAGRSGLVARAFVMRLVQMGLRAYAVGSVETPAIREGDLLIAISGSGKTHFTLYSAMAAKSRNAKVVAITAREKSDLSNIADFSIVLSAKTKDERGLFPLGTVFEDSALIFLELVVTYMCKALNISEEELAKRHNIFE